MPRANGITRREILTALKRNGAMTAEELAKTLGISQVAVRQHLSALEAERMVAVSIERRGLGRPSHRYLLTPQGDETFPRYYDRLGCSLLEALSAWQGEEAVDQLLSRIREHDRAAIAARLKGKPLPVRVQELARTLDERGYMADACALGENTFVLRKRNCVICVVAREHPRACCYGETRLYADVLGAADVTLRKSIAQGDRICEFVITAPSQAPPAPAE